MYEYNATCLRVIDGDTLEARVDLGFYVWVERTLRLRGVNTPEIRTKDLREKRKGQEAKKRVEELMEENDGKFKLVSHAVGKYGRVVSDIILPQGDLGDMLIMEGLGEAY